MAEVIEKIEIDKLFGRFDYSIDLNPNNDGICILTAPNGYGKSTILNIINNISSGNYFYFIGERYDEIRVYISNNEVLKIRHVDNDDDVIFISSGENEVKVSNPFTTKDNDDERSFAIERVFPFLTRIGSNHWRHDNTGEIFDRIGLISKFGSHHFFKRKLRKGEWLDSIVGQLNVYSISTNRLKIDSSDDFSANHPHRGIDSSRNQLMVDSVASQIKEKIQSAIRKQFEVGRLKETSFPTRLIESLQQKKQPAKESVIEAIEAIQKYEKRFGALGLLPDNARTTKKLNEHVDSTENTGMVVLKTYLDDIRERFSLLDDLAKSLDVFCRSINKLMVFKSIKTTPDTGIVISISDRPEAKLPLYSLSSGEQHLIVLIGKLIFNTSRGELVLVDEPEISFHPEWQEIFVSILDEIRSLNNFNVLMATHSPILIGERWDNVIELAEQYKWSGIPDDMDLGDEGFLSEVGHE